MTSKLRKDEFVPVSLESLLINSEFDTYKVKKVFDNDFTMQQKLDPAEIYRLLRLYKMEEQENLPDYAGDENLIRLAAVLYAEYAVRTIYTNIRQLFDKAREEVPNVASIAADFLHRPLILMTDFRELLYLAMDKDNRDTCCMTHLTKCSKGKDIELYKRVSSFFARRAQEYLATINEDFPDINRGRGIVGQGLDKVSGACSYIDGLIR